MIRKLLIAKAHLFNNEAGHLGSLLEKMSPTMSPLRDFGRYLPPWEMLDSECTSTVWINLWSQLTGPRIIFSLLDIFRGDIISRNLGSLFPK